MSRKWAILKPDVSAVDAEGSGRALSAVALDYVQTFTVQTLRQAHSQSLQLLLELYYQYNPWTAAWRIKRRMTSKAWAYQDSRVYALLPCVQLASRPDVVTMGYLLI